MCADFRKQALVNVGQLLCEILAIDLHEGGLHELTRVRGTDQIVGSRCQAVGDHA
jgi:hypothetical protein